MDISEKPSNSIKKIEKFIQKKFGSMQSDTKSNTKKRKSCLFLKALPSKKQKLYSKGLSDADHDGGVSNSLMFLNKYGPA